MINVIPSRGNPTDESTIPIIAIDPPGKPAAPIEQIVEVIIIVIYCSHERVNPKAK
jgi:hypothetical protein